MRECLACDNVSILHNNVEFRGCLHVIQPEVDEQTADALIWFVLVNQGIFGSSSSLVDRRSGVPINFTTFPSLDLLLVPWRVQQGSEWCGGERGYQCHHNEL